MRLALGAQRRALGRSIARESLGTTLAGTVTGFAIAWQATNWMTSITGAPFIVLDPWVLGAIVGLVTIVGLAAAFLPARRAMATDPIVSLRAN